MKGIDKLTAESQLNLQMSRVCPAQDGLWL
jgi:hypothetical protein